MTNKLLYFSLCLIIFAGLKLTFKHMNTDSLEFLLAPTSKAIGLIFGSEATYNRDTGYFHSQLNMVINKSCSGFNFWLISFLSIAFAFTRLSIIKKWQAILLSFFFAYLITLFANISRIAGYLMIMNLKSSVSPTSGNDWLHQAEGIFVYLSFLIISYLLLNYIIDKIQYRYEKTT